MKNFIKTCLNLELSDEEKTERLKKIGVDSTRLYDAMDGNGVSPAMYLKLKELGLLDEIPDALEAHLRSAYQRNAARNFALEMELERCLTALNHAGVPTMLLKGAITFVKPFYPQPGLRYLSDIDLLVERRNLAKAQAVLESLDYLPDRIYKPSQHHHRSLVQRTGVGFIELHHCPFALQYADWSDLDAWWADGEPVTLGGTSALIPSPEHQLLHLLLHNGMEHEGLLLPRIDRQLDFALTVEYYRDKIDWEGLSEWLEKESGQKFPLTLLEIYLSLVHRNLGLKPLYRLQTPVARLQSFLRYIDTIPQAPTWAAYMNSCMFNALVKSNNRFDFLKNLFDTVVYKLFTTESRRELKGIRYVHALMKHAVGCGYSLIAMLNRTAPDGPD